MTAEGSGGTKRRALRGAMAGDALAKSARLFDQSLRTVASELLQNARRAGATRVDVTCQDRDGVLHAVFGDDGHGIDDLAALVDLGRSGWDAVHTPVEDWAGMGVFCLSPRGCVVDSLGGRVSLTPAVFRGTETAARVVVPFRQGTSISFPLAGEHEWVELVNRIQIECLHGPVPVWVMGREMMRRNFLAGAIAERVFEGVRIGCQPSRPNQAGVAERPWDVNFGGHLLRSPDPLGVSTGLGYEIVVRWQLEEGAAVRLTLPTRDGVVVDEAWARLRRHSEGWLYQQATDVLAKHSIPSPLTAAQIDLARSEGFAMATPPMLLVDVERFHERESTTLGIHADEGSALLLADMRCCAAGLMAACDALESGRSRIRLAMADDRYDGRADYERQPRLLGVDLTVTAKDGRVIEIADLGRSAVDERIEEAFEGAYDEFVRCAPRRTIAGLSVTLRISGPDGESTIGPHPVRTAFVRDGYGYDDPTVLVSQLLKARDLEEAAGRQGRFVAAEVARENDGEYDDDEEDEGDDTQDAVMAAWWAMASQVLPKREIDLHAARFEGIRIARMLADDHGAASIESVLVTVDRKAPDGAEVVVRCVTNDDRTKSMRTTVTSQDGRRRRARQRAATEAGDLA